MGILDIILIIVLVLSILLGMKRGFFATIFQFISSFLAILAAKYTAARIAPSLYNSLASDSIESYVRNALSGVSDIDYSAQLAQSLNSMSDTVSGLMNSIVGVDTASLVESIEGANLSGEAFILWVLETIEPIATGVISGIAFVILAIVFIIAFKIIIKLLDKVVKALPVLKQANKSLGAVAGVLQGCMYVIIISMVLALIAGLTGSENFVTAVDSSVIISTIREFITSFSQV